MTKGYRLYLIKGNPNKAHLEIDILLCMCSRSTYIIQIEMCGTYMQGYIYVSVCVQTKSVTYTQ